MKTTFCSDISIKDHIIELLSTDVLSLDSEKVQNIYSSFKISFDEDKIEAAVFQKNLVSKSQQIPEDAFMLGIDLPIWFNSMDTSKRIMVLGVDPLRNQKTFDQSNADKNEHVIVGTPYALHMQKMRAGKTKHYWNFIARLADKHFVYVTDIYKTFFLYPGNRSYNYYQNRPMLDLLEKEIDLINPNVIITLGAKSYERLQKRKAPKLTENVSEHLACYKNGIQVLPMLHLSSSNRKSTFEKFFHSNKVELVDGDLGDAYYRIYKQNFE